MELVRDRQKFNLHFLFGQFSVLAVYLIKSNSRPKLKDLEVKKKKTEKTFVPQSAINHSVLFLCAEGATKSDHALLGQ